MDNSARRFSATIPVNESTLQLAESIASRYGVSVADLIDLLLLELLHRVGEVSIPSAQRTPGRVIHLDSRRQRSA